VDVEEFSYAVYELGDPESDDPLDGEVTLAMDLNGLSLVDPAGGEHTFQGAIRVSGSMGGAAPVPVAASRYGGWGQSMLVDFPEPELPVVDGYYYCHDDVHGICTQIKKSTANFALFDAKCMSDTGHPAQRHSCLPANNRGVFLGCDGAAFNINGTPVDGAAHFMIAKDPLNTLNCDQAMTACESADGVPMMVGERDLCTDLENFRAPISGFPVECESGVSAEVTIPAGTDRCQRWRSAPGCGPRCAFPRGGSSRCLRSPGLLPARRSF
jgi:hypothetical protein